MSAPAEPSASEIERFRSSVRRRLGLNFDDGKLPFLGEVLRRRTATTGRSAGPYLDDLEDGPPWRDELRALAGELTVGETFFFRNIEQFRALAEIALPERARVRSAERRLRILSAGCASGEETYTLAILAREQPALAGYQISIRGVDVNPAAIKRATAGSYSTWALRETSDEMRGRYFRPDGRQFLLDPGLKASVVFEERNLAEPEAALWQPESFDVVFCRNMLMYLAPEVARAIVDRIARSLAPGGYLFLGSAETLRGLSQAFHLCHTHGTFYYRRRDGSEPAPAIDSLSDPARDAAVPAGLPEIGDSWVEVIRRASERIRSLTGPGRSPAPSARSVERPLAGEPSAELSLIADLIRQERFSEARTALALLPPASARDPDALLLQAVLLTHGGDLTAAERLCAEVLVLDELSAGAHYLTALCRERAGDGRAAVDHDQAAVYLDSSFAMPHLHLGLLARRAGDPAAARRQLAEALTLLEREDPARLLMFGGGFGRESLLSLCRAELVACGAER
ncbi:MAG TPA: CheR family methyltransferase [Polyangia bacterium]|nr:CheR family methyltransferase [Polyangia bacterium]